MPLMSAGDPALAQDGRISFVAIDETGRPVTVRLTKEALAEMAPEATDDPLLLLEQHKAVVQWAAGKKYDAGVVEADGSVLVTSIDLSA